MFNTFLDDALRDRLVCGLLDEATQKKLLTRHDLTFQQAAELATMFEAASRDSLEIHEPRHSVQLAKAGVKRDVKIDKKPSNIKCYRCDGDHFANKCKFKDTICNKCRKKGHIAKACKSKSSHFKATVNMVEKNVNHRYSDEELNIYSLQDKDGEKDDYIVKVEILGNKLDMILDTAADLSTICETWYKRNMKHSKLTETKAVLSDYNQAPIKIIGKIDIEVLYKKQKRIISLHVVEGNRPCLFGKDMIHAFKMNIHKILNVTVVPNKSKYDSPVVVDNPDIMLETYKGLFQDSNSPIKHHKAAIKLREEAKPMFFKARSVPFAVRRQVENEIIRMKNNGVWEEVKHSDWATPLVIVPKVDNTVRLCGDFKVTVNKAMHVDQYPLPTQKELFAMMNGGKFFTKLDLKNAYQQIELEKASQEILTINTHMGLFRPKRLFYGVANASAIFQSVIDKILGGLTNVIAYQDDILVIGRNKIDHDKSLKSVLTRLMEFNVHLNLDKCKMTQSSIQYLGHVVDEKGIHPTDAKINDIKNAKIPTNVEELQMFLGLFNYYIRFVKDSSTLLQPLHDLLRKDSKWFWSKECQKALDKCKEILTSDDVLVHYDELKPLKLECDASPVGLGAILSHTLPDGSDKPIAYASRTLTKPEKNYAQVEKEALAIIFGLKKYEQYLFGRKFVIVTDHKPLLSIFSPSKATSVLAAGRLQRWSVLLSSHNYEILYRKGAKHINVDTLSRLPVEATYEIENRIFKVAYTQDLPVTAKDIENATSTDEVLSRVLHFVRHGWRDDSESEFRPYFLRREQLSTQDGCLLWGFRVVIPQKLRAYILELLHDTHPGVVKMKAVARSHVWWPGLDTDIENLSGSCASCTQQLNMPPTVPLQSWIWPRGPWERIHIDFAQKGPYYFLIVVDAHSKWLEVVKMENITTLSTIAKLRDMFARYGLPKELVSDNGPQLTSNEFGDFLKGNGIRHTLIPAYSPKSNGAAERCVQHFKNSLTKMNRDNDDNTSLEHKIARFLLTQRSSPHATTGRAPSELFIGRTLRTRISLIHSHVEDVVTSRQLKQKMCYDRSHCSPRNMEVGSEVLYRDYSTSANKWSNGVIASKMGTNTWDIDTGSSHKLVHTDQMQKGHFSGGTGTPNDHQAPENPSVLIPHPEEKLIVACDNETVGHGPRPVMVPQPTRKSTRITKKVVKMNL